MAAALGALSGGQRQRLAIARALLADAPLLLDDALSAVDTGTAARILANLRRQRTRGPQRSVILASHRLATLMDADQILVLRHGQVTVLAIAHRLSTIRDADQIIVLDHGRIAERGRHAELMAIPGGLYQRLVQLQQLADDDETDGNTPPIIARHG